MKLRNNNLDTYSVTCADMQGFLSDAVKQGITVTDVQSFGDLTFKFYASAKYRSALKKLADKHSAHLEYTAGHGFFWAITRMKTRKTLVAGLLLIALLSVILPQRVLFVEVSGNQKIPDNLILEKAALCGINFWSTRKDVRSEKVKNALLSELPQLQWAGVNTYGCNAVISVIERSDSTSVENEKGICSIVALRDGIIKDCTVTSGNPLCKSGQAVKKGQTLVSGYVDTGLLIRAVRAEAEISAETNRNLSVISMQNSIVRGEIVKEETYYSVIIGKKLINLFKDSGILDTTCVKISKIYPLTLPGGLKLPVSVICQSILYYEPTVDAEMILDDFGWLYEFAQTYLTDKMVAGKILQSDVDVQISGSAAYLTGTYSCEEMIGKSQNEEIIYSYAQDN